MSSDRARQATGWGLLGALAVYAGLYHLGRTSGSTIVERRAWLPGDDVVPGPQLVTDHAVLIDASPATVWPWLTQMGWHRAGWYTPPWVDRLLFPANWRSADHLDPRLVRNLEVGDTLPDGPPGTAFFRVEEVRPPHVLVLHSTTHVPPTWSRVLGARIDWTWSFNLRDIQPASTRLHLRVRGRLSPWWLRAAYLVALTPADHVMAHGMLRGLARRASPVR
jgi:hypothetical protein